MTAPFLSLCMIVRDEEPYLCRCLESLDGVADELIVVDTGSQDRTVEIAREQGARVELFDWADDFAAARNEACRFARGEWIFMVDGDEYLEPAGLGPHLRALVERAPEHVDKILIEQRTLLDDGGTISLMVDRLFRNRPGLRWKYRIHEVIETPAERTAMTREFCLLHDNSLKRRDDMRVSEEREQMYLHALALDHQEMPDDPRPAFYLASTLFGAGRQEEALEVYERYFRLSEGQEPARRAVAMRDAAEAAGALGDTERQRALLFRSLEQDWRPAQTYLALADLAQDRRARDEAIHWLTVATTCRPTDDAASILQQNPPEADLAARLADLHQERGHLEEARRWRNAARQNTAAPQKGPKKKKKKRGQRQRR